MKERFLRPWRIARALFLSQYSLMLEYKAEIALWALSGLLPLIMLSLWSESSTLENYDLSGEYISRYFVSAFIVRQFTAVWVMVSFEEDNLEGKLSPYILQPLNPFWRYYTAHIAEQVTRIPFVLIMLGIIYLFLPNTFSLPSVYGGLLSVISIFLAFPVRFFLHWTFAMFCFWNDKAASIERLLLIPYLFLSGLVAPLELFPPLVRRISILTPYPYILSFPAQLMAGKELNVIAGFCSLIIWLALFVLISIFAWKKGVRQYSAMGA